LRECISNQLIERYHPDGISRLLKISYLEPIKKSTTTPRMKKNILFCLFVLLFAKAGNTCINTESPPVTLSDGSFLYSRSEGKIPWGHNFDSEKELEKKSARLDSFYLVTKEIKYLSDKGVVLLLLKKYNEAVELYRRIEKIEPGRYSTASNMGTAYELLGQNDSALKWIRRSVEIDPESHRHSEWIHVKILEAKIGGERYYNSRFLLNTDFGHDTMPAMKLTYVELGKLSNELYYQLDERISFVKPKDKIVAQLLFDLGNIYMLMKDYQSAMIAYGRADQYGYSGPLWNKRNEKANQLLLADPTIRPRKLHFSPVLLLTAGALLLLATIIIIRVKKKKKHNNA
jgi:tetratricopeptide (TPR) repeat protein